MSWLSKINDIELTIITGDGKEYKPLWKEAKKNINFNNEAFDFIGIRGTFVERKEVQGTQYPILLYFSGEDCIEQANRFEQSSRDVRPWKIKHPFYDDITAQPLNLEFDNSQFNIVKITGTLWETIAHKYPKDTIDPQKEIIATKQISDVTVEETFTDDIETVEPSIIEKTTNSINKISSEYETITESSEGIQQLKDLARSASSAAQEIIATPTRYMNQAIALINFPFGIVQDVESKINAMINVFNDLTSIFISDSSTANDKVMYQSHSTVIFTELSRNIISTNKEDYNTRSNVLNVVSILSENYNSFLAQLDTSEITQDKQLSKDLDYIVNLTLGTLYDIAFDAKQERSYILDKDDNIITLAHRFIGKGEAAIDTFVAQNDIALSEYLVLKKGRKIIYYV